MNAIRRQRLTHRLTIRISERLASRLSRAATDADRSPGDYVRELLRRALLNPEGPLDHGADKG